MKTFPTWAWLSLIANGLLLAVFAALFLRARELPAVSQASASTPQAIAPVADGSAPDMGPRIQLTYAQWVALLEREAQAVATERPPRLSILLGDSLSLWFPTDLLPGDRTWLNQGISGETSTGLLARLKLFDRTSPDTIFLLIGVNDLLRGVDDSTILDNEWRIIRYLKVAHPQAQIVVQSILPHAGDKATWEGKERLKNASNDRIRALNQQLAELAKKEGVYFLDLHPLFTDSKGNMRLELTTDGLHLSAQGYWVWRSAIQMFSQLKLTQTASAEP